MPDILTPPTDDMTDDRIPVPALPPRGKRRGGGRKPSPGGGQVYLANGRVSLNQLDHLLELKAKWEVQLGRALHDAEFFRMRLMVGGEPVGEPLLVLQADGTTAPFVPAMT